MMLLLLARALAADCPQPVEATTLAATLDDAEAAYLDLDEGAFLLATDRLLVSTPCLATPLGPDLAARVHRTVALRLYGNRRDDALASLAAARRADPALGMGGLVGDAHPLAQAWTEPSGSGGHRVARAREGALWFDGRPSRWRPEGEAVLFQQVAGDHAAGTALLFPSDPLPDYPRVPPARRPLHAVALGTALGSVGTFVLASAVASGFDAPGQSAEQLRATRARTNGLVVASGLLGATAVSTGAASLVVR